MHGLLYLSLKTSTGEWEAASSTGELETSFRELKTTSTSWELKATSGESTFAFDGFLDAGFPVFVEAFDVLVEEGKAVGEPFFQGADLLFVGVDTIGCPHAHHIEAALAIAHEFGVLLEMARLSL